MVHFFTMIALGSAAGVACYSFSILIGAIPILLGALLGNLDEDMKEFL